MTALVFFVHSGITQIVAELAAAEASAPGDEIVCLSARGSWSIPGATKVLEVADVDPDVRHPLRARAYQRQLLADISTLTAGQEFRLFVPQSYSLKFRLMADHPRCVELNYIEEGVTSYLQLEDIPVVRYGRLMRIARSVALRAIFRTKAAARDEFFDTELSGTVYKIGRTAFPWASTSVMLPFRPEPLPGPPRHIIVVDYLDPRVPEVVERYLAGVREAVAILDRAGVHDVSVKFHPGQLAQDTARALETIRPDNGMELAIADSSLNLERAAAGRVIIGGLSAAVLYAPLLGGRGYFGPWVQPEALNGEEAVWCEVLQRAGVEQLSARAAD